MSLKQNIFAARFKTALDLYQTDENIMRQNLRRRYSKAGEKEIENRLTVRLQTRPDAEHGDYSPH